MQSRAKVLIVLVLLLFCSSCGYRFGTSSLASEYATISIPYIDGDVDGNFTATLVHQATTSLPWRYVSDGGNIILSVKILDLNDENIGFRYDYKKENERKKSIIPTETRLRMLVEVALVDGASGCPVINPVRLSAFIDFDHDYNYNVWRRGVAQFSLGELTDADAAFRAARVPLNKIMSQKIVDYINSL